MRRRHVILHQFDPTVHAGAGINLIARDIAEQAPPEDDVAIVGVDAEGKFELGHWGQIDLGRRHVAFMPVARLDNRSQERRIPHSVQFVAGLMRHRPDLGGALVHAHRVELGSASTVLYRRSPLIQFIHGDAAEFLPVSAETFWRFVPRAYVWSERFAVKRAARAIVVNTRARDRLRRYSPRVAHCKLSWYDSAVFHWEAGTSSPSVPRIAWSARVEPQKNPLLAVDVLAELRDRGVEFTAWLAGRGTLDREVREAVVRHRLDDRVELPGLLRPEEVARELRRSSAFLITSSWEGMPRGALEALGTGIPLVTTNVGELRSAVRDGVNGYLSSSNDAGELASLVMKALEIEAGPAVAATVADFELRRVMDEIYGLIDDVAAP